MAPPEFQSRKMESTTFFKSSSPVEIAVGHINSGDLAAAKAVLADLLAREGRHPVGLYLLGYIAFSQNRWADAESLLRKALPEASAQAKVLALLARTLRASGKFQEALSVCRQIKSPDLESRLETARSETGAGNPKAGEALLRSILPAIPAEDDATRAQLEHELGLTLKLQHRYSDALAVMKSAAARSIAIRPHAMDRASLAAELGRFDEAAAAYQTILANNPLDLEVHSLLNDIHHVSGRTDLLGTSYDMALSAAPGAVSLPTAKGHLFLKLLEPERARDAFQSALVIAPDDTSALAGLGAALEQLDDLEAARAIHEGNIAGNPENGSALEAFGQFLLRYGDARAALRTLENAIRVRPASQSGLALLGLAYRAAGDPRENWLNDYARDVQIFDLKPPAGFDGMNEFNAELADYLRGLHRNARQYPSQTLRSGTQTYQELFYQGHGLVQALLARINAAVQSYRSQLAGRADHPFASRLTRHFRHAGSWSSCLHDRGYHVNHIHQKGWISSCYYVAIPDAVGDSARKEGWLKFGEPPFPLGGDWSPQKAVRPVAGRLVLFPSYMWHGTNAFRSSQERITIAFDTVPA